MAVSIRCRSTQDGLHAAVRSPPRRHALQFSKQYPLNLFLTREAAVLLNSAHSIHHCSRQWLTDWQLLKA